MITKSDEIFETVVWMSSKSVLAGTLGWASMFSTGDTSLYHCWCSAPFQCCSFWAEVGGKNLFICFGVGFIGWVVFFFFYFFLSDCCIFPSLSVSSNMSFILPSEKLGLFLMLSSCSVWEGRDMQTKHPKEIFFNNSMPECSSTVITPVLPPEASYICMIGDHYVGEYSEHGGAKMNIDKTCHKLWVAHRKYIISMGTLNWNRLKSKSMQLIMFSILKGQLGFWQSKSHQKLM